MEQAALCVHSLSLSLGRPLIVAELSNRIPYESSAAAAAASRTARARAERLFLCALEDCTLIHKRLVPTHTHANSTRRRLLG
jgi:hypothetical protein